MICGVCPAGKRITRNEHGCVRCIVYGMVLKEDHECTREGWKNYDWDQNHRQERETETELPEDGGGFAAAV